MARHDLSKHDASDFAASELEYVIRKQKRDSDPVITSLSGEEAMEEGRVLKTDTKRDVTRVLFISRNTDLLNPVRQTLDGYLNISDLFDEVHILILRQGIPPKNPVLRAASNVWLYTATAKTWWMTPASGLKMVSEQLEFATGFRPDLIVARDPFESAVTAHKIAKKYRRPAQLHILGDYTKTNFFKESPSNLWRLFLPFFTIPKFSSIRTSTEKVRLRIMSKVDVKDIETLPRYQNYESLINREASLELKEKYKPLIFFMLFVGDLNHDSTFYKMIEAIQEVLHNQRVGLVVIGDGTAKNEFKKKVKTLGIEEQVVFESKVTDLVSYLKSANLLIVSDTTAESEELVLKGAASGIPMIMSRTQEREDVFTHGESTFLCDVDDVESFTARINDLLDNVGLRNEFVVNAQEIIRNKFHNNLSEYRSAYRNSIEQVVLNDVDRAESDDV